MITNLINKTTSVTRPGTALSDRATRQDATQDGGRRKRLLRIGVAVMLVASATYATGQSPAKSLPENQRISVEGLSPEAAHKVRVSATSFLKTPVKADRSANDLGWDCMAADQLAQAGMAGARERLAGIADELLRDVVRSNRTGKALGWASSGGHGGICAPSRGTDGNVNATCEGGSRTLFSFQSGLGLACLATAGASLHRQDYIDAAKQVMGYWERLLLKKAPCPGCAYFATSDSSSDEVRYVRNMNLFMAFGASRLAAATGADGRSFYNLAKQAVRADIWERENGNRGYLGRLDPIWTSRAGEDARIENHMAGSAVLLNVIGNAFNDPAISDHAYHTWKDWATCDNKRCLTAGCKYWAGDATQCQATHTAAHCAFRLKDPLARQQCEIYVANVPAIRSFGLWAVLQSNRR